MVSRKVGFNIIFVLALASLVLPGCKTSSSKSPKHLATVRVYMEGTPASGRGETVTICRSAPMQVFVEPAPFIYEAHVATASVMTNVGGYSLYLEMNREGTWLLEQFTSSNPQKRLVVRSQFGSEKDKHMTDRWLGAPLPSNPVRNGILAFAADATWEELDEIVQGLRAVAKANQNVLSR